MATLADMYARWLDLFSDRVARAVTEVATAPEGGVLVHCVAGKDRTGLISALALSVAGVDRETIATDYALSDTFLKPNFDDWLENGPGERAEREASVEHFRPRAEVMARVLDHLNAGYGGPGAYLRKIGVEEDHLTSLRQRMVG